MAVNGAYARVTSNQGVWNVTREQYAALVGDSGLFFIVDMVAGRAGRVRAQMSSALKMAPAPPKQLRVLRRLIDDRRPLTAKDLEVTDSTVEAARRLIEKPPGARGGWHTIRTIPGADMGSKRYHFDPEPELRWVLVDHPEGEVALAPEGQQAVRPLVTLSAVGAVYSAFDSMIVVRGANVVNRSATGCTVKRWELVTSISGVLVVVVASVPSGTFLPGEPWLPHARLRLEANDGAQGAVAFSVLGQDPELVDGGASQFCAILGDDTRLEVDIEVPRYPPKLSK